MQLNYRVYDQTQWQQYYTVNPSYIILDKSIKWSPCPNPPNLNQRIFSTRTKTDLIIEGKKFQRWRITVKIRIHQHKLRLK